MAPANSKTGGPVPRLVAGLGNPGTKYARTRHNVGFRIVERLASAEGVEFRRERNWDADAAQLRRPDGSRVVLLKPQTFMNLSGRAVAAAARFYKIDPGEVLVVFDDADLPLGKLRLREGGRAGGHKGMLSIIASMGTDRIARLKFGVDRENRDPRQNLIDHVLGQFTPDEECELENCLDHAADAVRYALACGLPEAMNAFNRKNPPPSSSSSPATGDGAPSPTSSHEPNKPPPRESGNTTNEQKL